MLKFNTSRYLHFIFRHFHDETGKLTQNLNLSAGTKLGNRRRCTIEYLSVRLGDDAEKVVWCPVDRDLQLYACHKTFLERAVQLLDAFW
jgi:hypothetical protein